MFIDHEKITQILATPPDPHHINDILEKSRNLQRLSLVEVAALLSVTDKETLQQVFSAAKYVKEAIYGKRLVVFAPLYISNLCANDCAYCAFRAANTDVHRRALNQDEIRHEAEQLLKSGQKRVLLVSGESYQREGLDYVLKSVETVYAARDGKNNIRRVNVNIAPLEVPEFKRLKAVNIGTYQIFQETYHRPTYQSVHLKGPKTNYDFRVTAIDRAFEAGIDDVGVGILFGLYDYRFEVLALMAHIEHLETQFGLGPHTISVPRLEPAEGAEVAIHPPYLVSDADFKKIIAVLRLAVPYTGIILSTRENALMRGQAFDLGVSQISAGSRTNPGGYSEQDSLEQFQLGDHRNLDEVILDVLQHGFIPSFCTGCYRLGRTGLDFMEQAKPGDIKKKCLPNALFTFMEYLEDYASVDTRNAGIQILEREIELLDDPKMQQNVQKILTKIKAGERDLYI